MATTTLTTTGPAVRAAMREKQVSQRAMADALNLSQPAVFRRLTGEVDFSVSELTAAADLLDTSVADLLSSPSPVASAAGDGDLPPFEPEEPGEPSTPADWAAAQEFFEAPEGGVA